MGKNVFTQRNLDFHAGGRIVSKDFNDSANWLSLLTGLLDNFHHHDLPGLGF